MTSSTSNIGFDAAPANWRRVKAVWLLAGVPLLVFAVLVVGVALLQRFFAGRWLTEFERKLPDGTILKVEAVTWGDVHRFDYFVEAPAAWWFPKMWHQKPTHVEVGTAADSIVVFMTRRDPHTGKMLNFEWWGESALLDAFGEEVHDIGPCISLHSSAGISPRSESGRFYDGSEIYYDYYLANSSFPPFRATSESLELRVKNRDGEVVATFKLKHPAPTLPSYPTWTADPLPHTIRDGDLEVTVRGIKVEAKKPRRLRENEGPPELNWTVQPDLEFHWKDKPSINWQYTAELSNALNTPLSAFRHLPSSGERVWKLFVDGRKEPAASFDEMEITRSRDLAIPASGFETPLASLMEVDDLKLTLVAIGGAGVQKLEFDKEQMKVAGLFSASFGYDDSQGKNLSLFVDREWSVATIEVDTPTQWLLIRDDSPPGVLRDRFCFRITNANGDPIKVTEKQTRRLKLFELAPQSQSQTKTIRFEVVPSKRFQIACFVDLPEIKWSEPE